MADTHLGLECDECGAQRVPGFWKAGDHCPDCHGHMRVPSRPARDGETLSDERVTAWRKQSETHYSVWGQRAYLDDRIVALCDALREARTQLADATAECAQLVAERRDYRNLGYQFANVAYTFTQFREAQPNGLYDHLHALRLEWDATIDKHLAARAAVSAPQEDSNG